MTEEASEQELTKKFQQSVEKHFSFLYDYGFVSPKLITDFKYPQDQSIKVEFMAKSLSLEVIMMFANISVGIRELRNGIMLEKYSFYGGEGYGRGIIVYDLVDYVTEGKVKRPLPEILPGESGRKRTKKIRESEELIQTNLDDVIEEFAQLTQAYTTNILKGDLTLIPVVQEYSKKKWKFSN